MDNLYWVISLARITKFNVIIQLKTYRLKSGDEKLRGFVISSVKIINQLQFMRHIFITANEEKKGVLLCFDALDDVDCNITRMEKVKEKFECPRYKDKRKKCYYCPLAIYRVLNV